MSTLNINELKKLATSQNLLGTDYSISNFQPSSYDLRIGSIFRQGKVYSKDSNDDNFANVIEIKPSEIVSMLTLEKVTIPNNCIGTVFAINQQSSTGLLILNPGHIDPGFSGHLSVCAINLSNKTKTLSVGDSIFTLIIDTLSTALDDGESYKPRNVEHPSRKEEDRKFLINKSNNLSNSVFDLVTSYDDAKKMLGEKIWNFFLRQLGSIIKFVGWSVGVIAVLYLIMPDYMPIIRKDKTQQDSTGIKNNLKKIENDSTIIRIESRLADIEKENQKLRDANKKLQSQKP